MPSSLYRQFFAAHNPDRLSLATGPQGQGDTPMKLSAQVLLVATVGTLAHAQFPSQIKHVVIVFQENRSPDNLFQGLHGLKGSNGVPYDIQNYWVTSTGVHKALAPA